MLSSEPTVWRVPIIGTIQRVLNDSKRTRLSHLRIIWLPPAPSPLSHQHIVSLSQVFLCVAGRAYWQARGGTIRRRESLVLYKSPNTIWHSTWSWSASFKYRRYYQYSTKTIYGMLMWMRSSRVWMRSSLVVRASDSQRRCRNQRHFIF